MYVNTWTNDHKYSRRNIQKFSQQLETTLSRKQKTFSQFFISFLKCPWKLEHSNKDEYPSLVNSKIVHSETGGYYNV